MRGNFFSPTLKKLNIIFFCIIFVYKPQKNWGCQWLPNSNVHGDGQLCGVANIVVREKSTGKLELLCPHSWLFINDIRYMKHDVDMCYAVSNQRATTNSLLYHMASKEKFFWDTIKAGRTK